jgi:hypothetical protein
MRLWVAGFVDFMRARFKAKVGLSPSIEMEYFFHFGPPLKCFHGY